jgi:V/A-type H+-transporting ATPase subunit D
MKYQFNKTAMQKLKRELQVRQRALPTLKAKETALRLEVKKAQELLEEKETEYKRLVESNSHYLRLWQEYQGLISVGEVETETRNVAGVKVPSLQSVDFKHARVALFANRAWVVAGTELLKKLVQVKMEIELISNSVEILYRARKKTTQKVNLYEKVQIPGYKEALTRIKSFLEDQENLARAAQKIVKERNKEVEV